MESAHTNSGKTSTIRIATEDEFAQDQCHQMRAGVYELLSQMLAHEPSEQILHTLASLAAVDENAATDGQLNIGWERLRQASLEASSAQLKEEYFDLFIGLGRGELVPFGSWYLTGYLMEKPVSVLRADLAALGIERQQGTSESEDHIASLCDAMALIIRSSDEIAYSRQANFFLDHLQPWAKRFFSDLQAARHARYYRSVGFFGETFITFEEELFSMQS